MSRPRLSRDQVLAARAHVQGLSEDPRADAVLPVPGAARPRAGAPEGAVEAARVTEAVLLDAEVVGPWRARSAGRRCLAVTVELFGTGPRGLGARLEPESRRLAAVRGLEDATVTVG